MEDGEKYTESDWLDEISEYFHNEPKQPGDIDAREIANRYGYSREAALRKMDRIARDNPGIWKLVYVRVPDIHQPIKVLRKINPEQQ